MIVPGSVCYGTSPTVSDPLGKMIDHGTDRIAKLEAEIAGLYRKVARIEKRCKSLKDKDGAWNFMLDLQSTTLRERARTLDRELSDILEVEWRSQ
jgi:hypothetical protein